MSNKCARQFEKESSYQSPHDSDMIALRSICMRYPLGRIKSIWLLRSNLLSEGMLSAHPILERHFMSGVEYLVDVAVKQMDTPYGVDFIPVPAFTHKKYLKETNNIVEITDVESQELVRLAGVNNIYCALLNRLIDFE